MSGLLRHTEGPDFKKAALVAVVTAGTAHWFTVATDTGNIQKSINRRKK